MVRDHSGRWRNYSSRTRRRELASGVRPTEDGVMRVPTGVGLGVELDLDRIRGLTVRETSFT